MPLSPDRPAGETGIPRLDVVALIAASTGIGAVEAVLRSLPEGLPTAVLVALEAGDETEDALDALFRQGALPVAWAVEEEPLRPGEIRVCPPGQGLEVFPDLTCAFSPSERPFDRLVGSLAESLGPRAVAVFLGGAGEDGVAGAFALRQAGGSVVAQSEDTAEHPVLPVAVASRGTAQLVLPLHEIGPLLTALANGEAIPPQSEEARAVEALFRGAGEMSELMRAEDWSRTPLGPVGGWSAALRASIGLALESPMPTIVLWGRDLVQLYNDPYRELMADKHPAGLGQSTRDCWPEVWHINEPIYERVFRGESVGVEDALYPIMRHGALHDVWLNVYYVPVRDEAGEVAGVMVSVVETTEKIVAARRFATLQALSTAHASTEAEVCERAAAALASNPSDLPFALVYRLDDRATLSGVVGLSADSAAAPSAMELGGGHPAWPLAKVAREATPTLLTDLDARFRGLGLPSSALLLPLPNEGGKPPLGILVVGINPRQPLDGGYRGFLDLIATRLGASLAAARSQAEEGERRERLAELDWAKNEFFANVSHEFRTPLTLMLAPLGELLYHREELPGLLADEVEVAARSARRLLTLVNTLLDFSQIEAGRMRLRREEADLAATTRDVAALFIPAAERAGLRLRIDCPPLAERAWVDVEMWEKIVSNLLSNALKFTFEGEIEVRLRELAGHVELVVRDTGVGIPKGEIPNLFKRFHRVRGTRARTQEGSGVGLALVDELVRLHSGRVRVRSVEGEGSAFTVWIPRGTETLDDALAPRATPVRHRPAATLAVEAARWGPTPEPFAAPSIEELSEMLGEPLRIRGRGARVLVVDDNADMRDHLSRLLAPHWDVETAIDGADALRQARQSPPELILADMAMPNVSGTELVRRVREDGSLRGVPVVLLTARAGEESAFEGLLAGADDYLVKPFSSRELIARVGAQIELAKVRGRAQELNEVLVRFSDAVRGSTDPRTVAERACALVAERLGVERAYWAEVDWTTREYVVGAAFHVPGVSVIGGRFPIDAWEPFTSNHLAGRSVVVDDTQADPRVPSTLRQGYAQIEVGADLAVPVTTDGRLVCTFAVNQRLPRRWTPEEVALVESVANRCWAEVVRARAEAALRESEQRQAFLLKLSDALRSLEAAAEIQGEATRLLRERLAAGWCYYVEWDEAAARGVVLRDATRDGLPSLAGTHDVSDVPAFLDLLRKGNVLNVRDYAAFDGLTPELRARYAALGFRSMIVATLVKHGRLVASLLVGDDEVRDWSGDAEPLLMEVAERTWAAVERARTESALRESNVRFGSIANLVPDLLWSSQPDGYTTWYNQRWSEYTGQAFERTTDWDWIDAIHPEEREASARRYQEALASGRTLVQEHRIRRSDGEYRWFLVQAEPVRDQAGNLVMFGSATDIHAQRTTIATVRESEARQAFLLELGDATRAQPSAQAVVEVAGRLLAERLNPSRVLFAEFDETNGFVHVFHAWLADGATPFPTVVRQEDFSGPILDDLRAGRILWVDDAGDPASARPDLAALSEVGIKAALSVPLVVGGRLMATLSVHQHAPRRWTAHEAALLQEVAERLWADVTRSRTEAALRESEEKYRTLFESIDEGLCVIEFMEDGDGRPGDYRYVEVNEAFARQTGLQDVAGKLGSEVTPGLEAYWNERYGEVVRTGEPKRFESYHEDTGRWYNVFASRVGGAESRQVCVVFEDATERKQRERSQEFLLKLSDALRVEPNADSMADRALRMLSEQMRLDRCYTAVYRMADDRADITHQMGNDRVPPMPDEIRLSDFPEALRVTFAGSLVIDDVAETEGLSDIDRRSIDALGLRALVAATLRQGETNPHWVIVAVSASPRRWTRNEIALLEEVTERTWAAMERARAEAALRESEARFRALSEAAPALIWRNDDEGENLFINQRFTDYTGKTADRIAGEGWHAIVHSDDAPTYVADYLAAVRDRRAWQNRCRLRRYDGAWRWFENYAQPLFGPQEEYLGHVGVSVDIDDAAASEAALRESEESFRALVNASSGVVYQMSPDWGEMRTLIGRGFLADTTDSNRNWLAEYIYPEDQARVLEEIRRAIDAKGPFEFEHRVRRADGTVGWTSSRAVPMFGENGEIVEWFGAASDVTERRRAQEALRESEARQTFLLRLSDALRAEPNADAVANRAIRMLASQMGLDHCYITSYRPEDDRADFDYQVGNGTVPHLPDSVRLSDFPEAYEQVRDRTFVFDDDFERPGLSEAERANSKTLGMRAMLASTARKGEHAPLYSLVAVSSRPRRWTPGEIVLIEEAAERVWTAIERARAEATLRESEAHLQVALDAAQMGTFVWDVRHDRTDADSRMMALLDEDEQGLSLLDALATMIHPADAPRYAAAVAEATRPHGSGGFREDIRMRRRDGGWRWLSITGVTFFDTTGQPLRMVGTALDVSETKRREQNAALLDQIGKDLSVLSAPDDIMHGVGVQLGEFLQAATCIFADVDEARNEATIHHGWSAVGAPTLKQTFRLADYFGDEFRRAGRAGEPVTVDDTGYDDRANAEAYAQLEIGAFVTVPFQRHGQWVANITVTSREPREWRPDEIELLHEIANRVFPRIDRAHADEALRESEARQTFLLRLSDVLQRLAEANDIKAAAMRVLGEHLGVSRAQYHECDPSGEYYDADGIGYANGLPLLDLKYRIDDFGTFVNEDFAAGRPFRSDDLEIDPRPTPEERDAYRFYGIRAGAGSALLRGGRLVAILALHDVRPRHWTDAEMELVRETAERVWTAVERTRVEASRRESEERQAFLLELIDALRLLDDSGEIERTAVRKLGQTLGATRVFYATIDEGGESWSVRHDYTDGAPSAVGRFAVSEFQRKRMAQWEAGHMSSIADSENDASLDAADREAYAAFGARAAIGVPLVRGSRFAALLSVNHAAPRRWTEAELTLTRETAERTWVAIERARAEATLRESETRLRAIAHSLPGGAVFVVDRDLRYTMAEGEALAAAGFGPEDLVGKTVRETMPPEIADQHEASYRTALAGGTFMVEHQAHGRSYVSRGLPLPSPNGTIDAALVVSYDVSERKRAEAALRESHALFDAALSSLPHHVYVMDAAGRFLYVNEALLAYWGIPHAEALGRTPLELGHAPEMAAQIASGIAQALATGGRVSGTFYNPSPSAPEVAYEYVYTPFHGASGPPDRVVGWSREIDPVARDR